VVVQRLPNLPIWLSDELHVSLELEASTWTSELRLFASTGLSSRIEKKNQVELHRAKERP
jgi:hypothetical protein